MAMALSAALLFAATLACLGGPGTSTPAGAWPTQDSSGTSSGSTTSGGGIADIGDPCHLLVQAEASQLFGHPADPGTSTLGTNNAHCYYRSGSDLLALNVVYEDQAAKDSSDYMSIPNPTPVPGLGDAAHFDEANWQLTVAKGHWLVSVNATLGGTNQGLDPLMPLAQAAVKRLPS
jgi:hypothetical protein